MGLVGARWWGWRVGVGMILSDFYGYVEKARSTTGKVGR